jgi:ABC-type microcin C transport system permease subunit YejB
LESKDEEGDSVEVVKKVTKNTEGNLTPASLGGQLQINRNDTVGALQESVAKLHARNQMLARQIRNITKIGGVDKYELMQIRKMVKEDLFKRVKFITTMAVEAKCMKFLSNKLNVPAELQHKWSAKYAQYVRDALNNKRNNVSQDLNAEIKR